MNRVLIADDHPLMLGGLQSALRRSDFKVVATCKNGAEVLDALPDAKPDILLLDLRMPVRDGMDVLREVRSNGSELPVVLVTAEISYDQLVEALRLRVSGILLKEGAQKILLHCLDEAMAGRRWIDEKLMDIFVKGTVSPEVIGDVRALTDRERAVAELVAQGLRNRDVASKLGISEGTVKVYLYRIYEKLGVANRTELALRFAG